MACAFKATIPSRLLGNHSFILGQPSAHRCWHTSRYLTMEVKTYLSYNFDVLPNKMYEQTSNTGQVAYYMFIDQFVVIGHEILYTTIRTTAPGMYRHCQFFARRNQEYKLLSLSPKSREIILCMTCKIL